MKVLFLGPYRDGTGYAHAAQSYILAMDAVGIDVVPRPIKLNKYNIDIPERIKELELKRDEDCNIVIQNMVPDMMDYDGHFDKNIGLFFTETDNFRRTHWTSKLNGLDEVWVACQHNKEACENSGVYKPIHVINVPCNPSIYGKVYKPYDIPEIREKFIFYFIGEITRRKNLAALLMAYHLEFMPNENVVLMIKGNLTGLSDDECQQNIIQFCSEIKKGLKLYSRENDYLGEVIVTQEMSDEDIMRIHTTGNCLVAPSYGEGWGQPAFDAMCMGKTPICSDTGGHREFMNNKCGWMVETHKEPCFGMIHPSIYPLLYTGKENWDKISILSLQKAMRDAYENENTRQYKAMNGINRAQQFSYENIGKQILEVLNGVRKPILSNRVAQFKKIDNSLPMLGIK